MPPQIISSENGVGSASGTWRTLQSTPHILWMFLTPSLICSGHLHSIGQVIFIHWIRMSVFFVSGHHTGNYQYITGKFQISCSEIHKSEYKSQGINKFSIFSQEFYTFAFDTGLLIFDWMSVASNIDFLTRPNFQLSGNFQHHTGNYQLWCW